MATVAKGYDLDYAWRAVGEAYRGAGYYLAATKAGEPPGTWWGPGAERLGFAAGQVVEREPYNLLFGERKGPDGRRLGRAPANAGKAVEIYQSLVAAEPGANDHRKAELRITAQRQARQSPLYFDLTTSWSKDISIFHASLGAAVQRARDAGDKREESVAAGLLAEVDQILRDANNAALAYFQREAGYVRTGSHVTRVDGRESGQFREADLIVASWYQHTSRDGDMQLHTHNQIAHVDLESVVGRERLAAHFVQRRRADIRSFLGDTPFPQDRLSQERPCTLAPEYKGLFSDVLAYARETVQDPSGGPVRQRVRYWSALALLRALASSPRAAAVTLLTRARNLDAEDVDEADQLGRSAVLDLPDEETYESADAAVGADDDAAEGDTPQRRRLRRFARRAQELEGSGDRKLAEATQIVTELLLDGFNPIVFCRFIDTAEYVADHLAAKLGPGYAVAAVTGTLPPDERIARIEELASQDGRRPVLVATDCLSEGVNLQQHFQAVVHYDLAWNPTRHEQREGRVDRFGQVAPIVRAVTLYGIDNAIDGIVLNVLLRKHEQIRKALGISVPVPDRSDDVVQAILEGLLLGKDPAEPTDSTVVAAGRTPTSSRRLARSRRSYWSGKACLACRTVRSRPTSTAVETTGCCNGGRRRSRAMLIEANSRSCARERLWERR
jgi:Helicase conserved C-terminal domain/TrwC relaxase